MMSANRCVQVDESATSARSRAERVDALRNMGDVTLCIKRGLEKAFREKDWRHFESYTGLTGHFPSPDYVPILTAALDTLDPHTQPAEILLSLQDLKDPGCVASVRRALLWKPDFDEFSDLAFKALDTLLAVGTPAAWQVIEEAAASDDRERIRSSAERVLREIPR
ncbi:HEAT repeat domain-containing protein [Amycolatopsis pithecellobii]|uniref:HEAT repeat domain-containing protein n=1 Tax=Amycolatopsis pithecellobii TaxID=664692 RepID=UPI001FE890D3|nr:HEAT repeat domain-containing protein [Amycolatopsis pithecellobii]